MCSKSGVEYMAKTYKDRAISQRIKKVIIIWNQE